MINELPVSERNTTSRYAAEGHAAHMLAAHCLREGSHDATDFLGYWACEDSIVDTEPEGKLRASAEWFEVTEEMAEAVQVYLDEVEYHRQRFGYKGEEMIESTFDMTWLRDDMGGTADFIIFEPWGELVVIDYKHGQGVVVEVEWNSQEMYYALGAAQSAGGLSEFSKVTIVIVQPRARHERGPVRRWEITADSLDEWAEQSLGPAADATRAPDAPIRAGEWCRFCPAQATCPAQRALVQETTKMAFDEWPLDAPLDPADHMPPVPEDASPDEITRVLNAIPVIEAWCKQVLGMAQRRLERGHDIPYYKLVRGRANRRWKDAAAVEKILRNKRGVKIEDTHERKLKSPAKLEKIKTIGKDWVKKYAEKPEGRLTLAHASDPREAAPPPMLEAFTEVEREDDFLS